MSRTVHFEKAEFVTSIGVSKDIPVLNGTEIAFSGRSNVGKSSMINALCNRKSLARVSSTPGKTTTINLYSLGEGVFLTDLPGYGYAKRSGAEKQRWSVLMEEYFHSGRDVALVVQLLDIRHDPTDNDFIMLDYLEQTEVPFIVALTKTDKLSKTLQSEHSEDFRRLLQPYRPLEIVAFSKYHKDSVSELKRAICRSVEGKDDKLG